MNDTTKDLLDEIGGIGDRLRLMDPGWERTWERAQDLAYSGRDHMLRQQLYRLRRKHRKALQGCPGSAS